MLSGIRSISRRSFLHTTMKVGYGACIPGSFLVNRFGEQEPVIDIHQHLHYHGRTDDDLLRHQANMGVTTSILLPAGSPVNRASTNFGASNGLEAQVSGNEEACAFAGKHPGKFLFGTAEVPDLSTAHRTIRKYLERGASLIGELKFAVDCDSRHMHKIYALAAAFNVPVLMHWQHGRFNFGFDRFHKILEKYPDVVFIGHAQTWWTGVDKNYSTPDNLYPTGAWVSGGITDRLLADYPNMYGDLSAGSGLNFFTRDEEQASMFINRHQHKLLFGSDCEDVSGMSPVCQGAETIRMIRKLAGSRMVERKLLYENAKALFRL